MSVERFKDDLIKHLMAALRDKAPERLDQILRRHGFEPFDVTFRKTQRHQTYTQIWRWPWDPK